MIQTQIFSGSADDWNLLVQSFECAHPFQFWEWGRALELSGWKIERLRLFSGETEVGAVQVCIRNKGPFSFAYATRGPLCHDSDLDTWVSILQALQLRYRKMLYFKVNPWIQISEERKSQLIRLGFQKPYYPALFEQTAIVDLRKSEEELRQSLRKTFRHDIRKSQESGIQIKTVTSESDYQSFIELHRRMNQAKKIPVVPRSFFENIFKTMMAPGHAILRAAYDRDRMVSSALLLLGQKKVIYSWGASDPESKEDTGSKHLHWESMLWAKAQGFEAYDLGGVDHSHVSGVAKFKEGFHGELVSYDCEWDWIPNRFQYRLAEQFAKLGKLLKSILGH